MLRATRVIWNLANVAQKNHPRPTLDIFFQRQKLYIQIILDQQHELPLQRYDNDDKYTLAKQVMSIFIIIMY